MPRQRLWIARDLFVFCPYIEVTDGCPGGRTVSTTIYIPQAGKLGRGAVHSHFDQVPLIRTSPVVLAHIGPAKGPHREPGLGLELCPVFEFNVYLGSTTLCSC